MADGRGRRGYLDWMRGLAVLIMIEAHVVDSWTAVADRSSPAYRWAIILGGFGAPLFLFLAGVSVVLSAGARLRRSGDASLAARQVVRRGLEIFLLAFVFRVQAWILGWSSVRTLIRVDILNIMGPSIMAAAALWGLGGTRRSRAIMFAAATLAMTLLAPVVRTAGALGVLPDPVEAYIRPVAALSNFVFFPWAGFVFAGALIGLAIEAGISAGREARLNAAFGAAGLAAAFVAYEASFLPGPYARSDFWTTAPSFFFIRLGLMTAAIGAAYLWETRPGGRDAWSPLQQLGRTSLFIYWVHVEMVYGLISMRLHRSLPFGVVLVALVIFSVFMLLCSMGKDRFVEWWRSRPQQPSPTAAAGVG